MNGIFFLVFLLCAFHAQQLLYAKEINVEGMLVDVKDPHNKAYLLKYARWIKLYAAQEKECGKRSATPKSNFRGYCLELKNPYPEVDKFMPPVPALRNFDGKKWHELPLQDPALRASRLRDALLTPQILQDLEGYLRGAPPLREIRTQSFFRNIIVASERILADWDVITRVFFTKGKRPTRVVNIQHTHSDFHKGGTEVLIITFLDNFGRLNKVVYKPSDMELDALITGDLKKLYRRYNGPLAPFFDGHRIHQEKNFPKSIIEIFNSLLAPQLANHLTLNDGQTELLGTYLVLPRNPGSKLPLVDDTLDIRQSYGYSQYLYERPAFKQPEGTKKLSRESELFLKKIGYLAAIINLFDIRDRHIDNALVYGHEPLMLDLDTVFSEPQEKINLNGFLNRKDSGVDKLRNVVGLHWDLCYNEPQNWCIHIENAYCDGVKLILRQSQAFDAVWHAAHNMVARTLIMDSQHLEVLGDQIFRGLPLKPSLHKIWQEFYLVATKKLFKRTAEFNFNKYIFDTRWPKNAELNSLLKALAQDYAELDLPTFWHRVSSRDLLNSRGEPVVVQYRDKKILSHPYFDEPPIERQRKWFNHLATDKQRFSSFLKWNGCPVE